MKLTAEETSLRYCTCVLTTHLTTVVHANLFLIRAVAVQLTFSYPLLVPPTIFTFSLVYVVCDTNFFWFSTGVFMLTAV